MQLGPQLCWWLRGDKGPLLPSYLLLTYLPLGMRVKPLLHVLDVT